MDTHRPPDAYGVAPDETVVNVAPYLHRCETGLAAGEIECIPVACCDVAIAGRTAQVSRIGVGGDICGDVLEEPIATRTSPPDEIVNVC